MLLCRYDRPDDVSDAEAVGAGYCNIQLESIEGANVVKKERYTKPGSQHYMAKTVSDT